MPHFINRMTEGPSQPSDVLMLLLELGPCCQELHCELLRVHGLHQASSAGDAVLFNAPYMEKN